MKKKKILIIGSNEKFTLELMYLRAFKSLNHNVKFYHTENIVKNFIFLILQKLFIKFHYLLLRKKMINFFKKNQYKFDLIIVFKGIFIDKKTLLICKRLSKNSVWINIFPDDPWNFNSGNISNKNVLKCMYFYDYYCLWSKKIIKRMKSLKLGNKTIYLPFAYDPLLHKRKKVNKFIYDINFIGTFDKIREKVILNIHKYKLIVAGSNWPLTKKFKQVNVVLGNKYSNIIAKSRISLNILRPQNITSHNMKTFEIPAMNGLLLTRRSTEQNIFFPENVACLMYDNENEIIKKIEFVIKNPKKALKIRKFGNKISQKHTYKQRSYYLLKKIFY